MTDPLSILDICVPGSLPGCGHPESTMMSFVPLPHLYPVPDTKCHKLSGITNRNVLSHDSGSQNEDQVVSMATLLLRGPGSFPFQLLEFAGNL